MSQDFLCDPLVWPIHWDNLSPIARSLAWLPVFGWNFTTWRDLCRQQMSRPADVFCCPAWSRFSDIEVAMAKKAGVVVRDVLGWPAESFCPNDPLDIVLWDRHGGLANIEAITGLEPIVGRDLQGLDYQANFGSLFRSP